MEDDFLSGYPSINDIYDEMMSGNVVRNHYRDFVNAFSRFDVSEVDQKNDLAKKLFMTQGITFTVYNDGEGIEKIFPFDVVPRIIQSSEWEFIQKGIKQRLKAQSPPR